MRHMTTFTIDSLLSLKTVDDPACRFTDRYGRGGNVAAFDLYVLQEDNWFQWVRYAWTEAQARREAKQLSYQKFTAVKVVNSDDNTVAFFAYGKELRAEICQPHN